MQTNRICKTCGVKYFYCSNCDKTLQSPQWMLMWHEENCKNVFEIVSAYVQKQIDKVTAKERLSHCNLKNLYSYKENIRKYVEEILEEDKKVVEEKKQFKAEKIRPSSKRNRQQKRN